MKRVYHPYTLWEEVKAGMWESMGGQEQEDMLQKAIEFTGNHELYGSWMLKVIENWPYSCENSLTAININRKAWLGHAAVAMAFGCPEYITRRAWGFLTEEQRSLANDQAQNAINLWERKRRLKIISEHGKSDVIWMEYPMKLRGCLKQLDLFQAIEESA